MTYLQASSHRSTLNTKGKNSHKGYVHKGVVAGGSDKAELSIHWVWIQLFEVLNIFGIFCVYKLFMFIYNFSVNIN